MPKCVKCSDMLPPQFLTVLEGVKVEVNECLFCKMDTTTITLPPDEMGMQKTYTKEEAKREYQALLSELKHKLKTREDLKKFMKGEF